MSFINYKYSQIIALLGKYSYFCPYLNIKEMKKILLSLFLLFPLLVFSQERRNLLTNNYNRAYVAGCFTEGSGWVKYPAYSDRAAWESLPESKRLATIAAGEKYLGYKWPNVLPSMYLEFVRTGNRAIVDSAIGARLNALQSLLYAELVEGKGRFLDDIINGVFTYCEQTYWGSSAHFYLYEYGSPISEPTTILPDDTNPVIDLKTGDVASTLAWTWHFLHEEFDKVSPVINDRLLREMQKKILDPYYEKNDMWWITGWNAGNVNNWTPWCSYNVLTSILLLEKDPAKKLDGICKTMQSVDLFINSYPEDGGCNEGPSYWGAAVGHLFNYLTLLRDWSGGKIDIFQSDIISEMGRYIYKLYIGDGVRYVNFADAPVSLTHNGMMIRRYGLAIGEENLAGFGSFLAERFNQADQRLSGDVGAALADAFVKVQDVEPKEVLVADAWLPDLEVGVGRDKANTAEGFFFAAKGGNNGEQHNHNDVGSFVLYYDGKPVFVDPGVGAYTRETFSGKRYEIWTMQSGYHNLPVISGVMQHDGGGFKARNSAFKATSGKVSFSTDIAEAYPEAAGAKRWVREYTLERGRKFTIHDSYELSGSGGGTEIVFMTPLAWSEHRKGVLTAEGEGFKLTLSYPSGQVGYRIEEKGIDDSRLRGAWGEKIYRIVFEPKAGARGELEFSVTDR